MKELRDAYPPEDGKAYRMVLLTSGETKPYGVNGTVQEEFVQHCIRVAEEDYRNVLGSDQLANNTLVLSANDDQFAMVARLKGVATDGMRNGVIVPAQTITKRKLKDGVMWGEDCHVVHMKDDELHDHVIDDMVHKGHQTFGTFVHNGQAIANNEAVSYVNGQQVGPGHKMR